MSRCRYGAVGSPVLTESRIFYRQFIANLLLSVPVNGHCDQLCSNERELQEAQLLLGDRATREHAKDC